MRLRVSADVLGNWRSDSNCSVINQILDLIPEGTIVVSVVTWGVHKVGASVVVIIVFRQGACDRFGLDSGDEVANQSF